MHFMMPGESNRLRHFRADVDVTFLNNNGFYELPLVQSGTTTTLRVVINGTDSVKNGTVIRCQAVHAGQQNRSTIIVLGKYRAICLLLMSITEYCNSIYISSIRTPSFNLEFRSSLVG